MVDVQAEIRTRNVGGSDYCLFLGTVLVFPYTDLTKSRNRAPPNMDATRIFHEEGAANKCACKLTFKPVKNIFTISLQLWVSILKRKCHNI
jgi:hypothetical protein